MPLRPVIKKTYLRFRAPALRLLSPLLRRASQGAKPHLGGIKRILFVRIDRIGDMVLSTPAFRAIKKHLPAARLTVLAGPANAAIILNNPHVDEIIVYDRNRSLLSKRRFVNASLRDARWDVAIDGLADYSLESPLLCLLSKAPCRIGYPEAGRDVFFNVPMNPPAKVHMAQLMIDLLSPLGIGEDGHLTPEAFLADQEKHWAEAWLSGNSIHKKDIIAIHPGAYYETQKWPRSHYRDLVRRLIALRDVPVIVFGGQDDQDAVAEIISGVNSEKVSTFVGDNLRQFMALLSYCRLLICNNSGPLHLASALGIPTISFMGPTDKIRWHPLGEHNFVFRMDHLDCIGCESAFCHIQSHLCMNGISAESVYEKISNDFL